MLNMRAYNLGMLFEEVCMAYSDRPAVKSAGNTWTYAEINRLANQLGVYLAKQGMGPGDVVAIVHTKEMASYALMLACLKRGIAYTNMDRDNPVQRAEAILRQCTPRILFADTRFPDDLCEAAQRIGIPCCLLHRLDLEGCSPDNDPQTETFSGSRIAYIMFTSGSTGVPKGVAITHQNVLSFIEWTRTRYRIMPEDVFANLSPMYFDNSVFDFYTAFFTGACLAPVKKELLSNPKELVQAVETLGCTIWFSVPSMLIFLMTMRALTAGSFKTLRLITFGGEGFPKPELKKLFDLYQDRIEFINVYGPTEGTCICSSHTITPQIFENMEGLPSLGPINPNFEYVIIDENNQAGPRGELCLLGPNIGIGYYKDPERSAQAFSLCFEHGFYGVPMYKTGDLVYEENGLLFFIGRKDNQIKHMGYRIELEEIELALCRLESVRQAAVLYERVSQAYGKIVAFVAGDAGLSQNQVREELKKQLPDYMLPNVIMFYDVLPKNPNGKVDKKELRRRFNQE